MVTVTFERLLSRRLFDVAFDLGSDDANNLAILREAWNTRSTIVKVVR